MTALVFDAPDLHAALSSARPEEKDQAAFGIVQLDESGTVSYYNRREPSAPATSPQRVLGRNIFRDLVPGTNHFRIAQKFAENREVDETIDYFVTVRTRPTRIRLRILITPRHAARYLLVQKQ